MLVFKLLLLTKYKHVKRLKTSIRKYKREDVESPSDARAWYLA